MGKLLQTDDVLELLRKAVGKNQGAWATRNGLSPAYVSDVLRGKRGLGPRLLSALGLEAIQSYRKTET